MNGSKKKKIAVGIVLLFLSTGILNATSLSANEQVITRTVNPSLEEGVLDSEDTVSYTFDFGQKNNGLNLPISEIKMSRSDSFEMEQKLLEIDQKLENTKNHKDFENLLNEKIGILISYGCLPSFFSLENLTALTNEISGSIYENSISSSPEFPDSTLGFPYLGVGPGLFAYISPLGTTTPFGLWNLTHWGAVGIVNETNITINHSGIYIRSTSVWFEDRHIEITGPIWTALWEFIGEEKWINYMAMHGIAAYMIEALIGHTTSWSIAWSSFPHPEPRKMAGSFYYFGGPTIPISFTLYKTHPKPWTTVLDIGFIFSLIGQVIFPFWFVND